MNYTYRDEFLSADECNNLISDALKIIDMSSVSKRHGGRFTLASSDIRFSQLYKHSKYWKNLLVKINSDEFLKFCCKELDMDYNMFRRVKFYNTLQPSKFQKHFKSVGNGRTNEYSNIKLIQFIIYRLLRRTIKYFKFSLRLFDRRLPVELLFDFSKAANGYGREIHRDSDSRLIVFLIYFNELSEGSTGGTLDLYKYAGQSDCIPSQPPSTDCMRLESIVPSPGKLVIFENTSESLHSVPDMNNNNGYRYFIYGAFTLLGGKNPNIKNSCGKLETPFDLYI